MNAELTATGEMEWKLPSQRVVGMICVIMTESALFTIFVVAYLFYIGKSVRDHTLTKCWNYRFSVLSFSYRAAARLWSLNICCKRIGRPDLTFGGSSPLRWDSV